MKNHNIIAQAGVQINKESSVIESVSNGPQYKKENGQKRQITDGEIRWLSKLKPMTTEFVKSLSKRQFEGRRIACRMHMVWNFIPIIEAFKNAGADLFCIACSPHSVDMATVDYLESKNIKTCIPNHKNNTVKTDRACMNAALEFEPDIISDMGGELIEQAIIQKQTSVIGALEATKSGVCILNDYLKDPGHTAHFPVFNWNDIYIKNRLENRFHVGEQVWPVFNSLTRMSLIQKKVLVIGAGPVGLGVAERALRLGGLVTVFDKNPTLCLEATYTGCNTAASIEEALGSADIIVTATGSEKVISKEHMAYIKEGAVLFNVGHFNHEIDIDFFDSQSVQHILPHLKSYTVKGKEVFILADGHLLNLTNSGTILATDIFDIYTTIIAAGMEWLLDGHQSSYEDKIHLYPHHLEQKVAQLALKHLG